MLGVAVALVPAAHVVAPPSPFVGTDKQRHLVYQIQVHNNARDRIRLDRLEVAGRAGGPPLKSYRGAAIAGLLRPIERTDRRVCSLRRGRKGVLFLDVALPRARRVPNRLVHRLRFTLASRPRRTVTVIATRNDLPDNTPVGTLPQPVTLDNAAGNYVVQSLPGRRYALYAHFQPGTVRVAPGDRVQAGQVLGLVGNSGNSDEAHLHFHLGQPPGPVRRQRPTLRLQCLPLRRAGAQPGERLTHPRAARGAAQAHCPAAAARRHRRLPLDRHGKACVGGG